VYFIAYTVNGDVMKTYEAMLSAVQKIGYSKGQGQYKLFFTDKNGELGQGKNNDRFAINSVNGDLLFTEGGIAEKTIRKIYGNIEFQRQMNYPLIKNKDIL
jgi:hypothetical protein